MKSVSPALAAHLDGTALTLAACWKVTRRDGTVLGFTAHDEDLTVDLGDGAGPVLYRAASGFTRSDIESRAGFSADNLEVAGLLESAAITAADLRAGRYDFAEIELFEVDYAAPGDGPLKLRRGQLGEVRREGALFIAELRGLIERTAQEIGEVTTPACRAELGDLRCKVRLAPPVWQPATSYGVRPARDAGLGAVVRPSAFNDRHFECVTAGTSGASEPVWNTALGATTSDGTAAWRAIRALTLEATVETVTDRRDFTVVYAGDAPDALMTGGLARFTTGANAGLAREVKTWALAARRATLFLPLPFDLAPGDAVLLEAGCDKALATCRDTFDNVLNFRGEPYLPGNDLAFRTPAGR